MHKSQGKKSYYMWRFSFIMQIQGLAWICHSMWVAREQQWKCVLSWAMCFQWVEPLVTSQQPSCSLMVMQVRNKHLIRWSVWVLQAPVPGILKILMACPSKRFWEESIQIARSCLHPLLLCVKSFIYKHSEANTSNHWKNGLRTIATSYLLVYLCVTLPLIYCRQGTCSKVSQAIK